MWLVLGLTAVALVVLFIDAWAISWVGRTDLEVVFVVVDGATGEPVEGADVAVQSGGGFYADEGRDAQGFALRTDAAGEARRVCHRSMSFGTQSGLRFTDTFAVHLPWWRFRVSAPGYEPVAANLDELEHRRAVEQTGKGQSRVVVRVFLHQSRP
jgi:hypothetical protein